MTRFTMVALSLLLAGCKGGDGGSCMPGETQWCACPGGTTGTQVCNAQGDGWEACDCGEEDTSTDPDVSDVEDDGPCVDDGDCDNGLVCDGADTCEAGECLPGDPVECDDGDDCTTDVCEEDSGGCVYVDRDEDGDGYVDAHCGGEDCDDTTADVFPEHHPGFGGCEDGVDNDCDGQEDEWTTVLGTRVFGDGAGPRLLWMGSEFGAVWNGPTGFVFSRLSGTGEALGSTVELGTDPINDLAWTGSEIGVLGTGGDDQLVLRRLSSDGETMSSDVLFADRADQKHSASLAWDGSRFGVQWTEPVNVLFAIVTVDGTPVTDEIVLREGGDALYFTDAAWTGSEFGAAWWEEDVSTEEASLLFTRVDGSASEVGTETEVTRLSSDYMHRDLSLAWTGSQFGLLWMLRDPAGTDFMLRLQRVEAGGALMGTDTDLFDSSPPSSPLLDARMVWTESEFGVAWRTTGYMYLETLGPDGSIAVPPVELMVTEDPGARHDLAWTSSMFALGWSQHGTIDSVVAMDLVGACD